MSFGVILSTLEYKKGKCQLLSDNDSDSDSGGGNEVEDSRGNAGKQNVCHYAIWHNQEDGTFKDKGHTITQSTEILLLLGRRLV